MSGEHDHTPKDFTRAFALGIVLNFGFVAREAFYGWKVGPLALLADARHNLSDLADLVLAWGGALTGRLRPNARHTYGWKRVSILAAFASALLLLLVAMESPAWAAISRLAQPSAVQGGTIMTVAGVGIVIKTATALLFMKGGGHDLNIRGAFLYMVADAIVSAGVVVAGGLTLWKGWDWLDPVVSLVIVVVILAGTWGLFRQSLQILFDGGPFEIDSGAVQQYLESLPGVRRIYDLHIWAMSISQAALIAHQVMPADHPNHAFLEEATQGLHDRFEIKHVTLQVMQALLRQPCEEGPTVSTTPLNP